MKINNKFMLKEMAGSWILVPLGENALDFNGVITLNETAKFLYEYCSTADIDATELKNALIKEYKISDETAANAVYIFVKQLKEADCIDE